MLRERSEREEGDVADAWSVVVWNMNEAGTPKPRAWAALGELGADVALLNEARVPKEVAGSLRGGVRTVGLDPKKRDWATAIASPHEITDLPGDVRTRGEHRAPFARSREGSWEAALVAVPGVGRVTAISLYGLMDERSDASVHRSLSDLTPVFEDGRLNKLLVLGGDLNTWTGWPEGGVRVARDASVLRRIEAFGLVDVLAKDRGPLEGCVCTLGDECRHVRTRLDRRYPDTPYQMDYLYASPKLAERLESCDIVELENSPSDHFPIRAEFR